MATEAEPEDGAEAPLLHERVGLLQALMGEVRDYALCAVCRQGRIQAWPPAAERLLGYTAAEAVGLPLAHLFTHEARAGGEPAQAMQRATAQGEFSTEGHWQRRDGSPVAVALVLTALRGADGELLGFLQWVQDIGDRKAREQAREDALQACQLALAQAKRSSESKGEFLSTLSHELRTPLSAIVGWSHVLTRGGFDPATLKHGLDAIARNAQLQVKLIEQLLDMNRIEAGQLRLEPLRLELDGIVAAAVEAARPQAEARGLALRPAFSGDGLCVLGDAARLQQVVTQLLDNAIKFTTEGGDVAVAVRRSGTQALMSVSDTGQGIAPAFLARVFDRFQQQDAGITRRHGGLGIGLTLVHHLVQLHGGSVEAYSDGVGQGARFTVRLPAMAEAPAPQPAPLRPPERVLDGVAVLLVDDEPDVRTVTAQVLVQAGARVTTAASAEEGLRLLQQHRPAVLLSDIGMPWQDGYELIRRVRALPAHAGGDTPAAALTAYAGSEDRARALDAGFQAHLAKPVKPETLVATVAQVASAGH